jgi:5'-3' exoribonuclease 2
MRHVVHGLDADLIMLALATHEPHFCILRELVLDKRKQKAKEEAGDKGPTPFCLCKIWVLREYLHKEFVTANWNMVPGGYDLEKVIDDFVFMCFFVGNDFLPHLPSLQIRDGALDTLCALYVTHFHAIGGWIVDGGEVDLQRMSRFSGALATTEPGLLEKHASSEEHYLQGQRRREQEKGTRACEQKHTQMRARVGAASGNTAVLGRDADVYGMFEAIKSFSLLGADAPSEALPAGLTSYQRAMAHNYCDELGVSHDSHGAGPHRRLRMSKLAPGCSADEESFKQELVARCKDRSQLPEKADAIQLGRSGYRQRFYCAKFPNLRSEADVDDLARDLAISFAEGLCFVMRYYYQGCPSWKWYYPFHYAPFAADLATAITHGQPPFVFELGEPFEPLQQLLGVLPPRSAHALPTCLAELMVAPTSPLADLYPSSFEVDMNGKRFMWQAIIKLPFIEERRLIDACKAALGQTASCGGLTQDEIQRNARSEALLIVGEACRTEVFRLLVGRYDSYDSDDHMKEGFVELTGDEGHELVGRLQLLPSAPRPHAAYPLPSVHGVQASAATLLDFENRAISAAFSTPQWQRTPSARPELLRGVVLDPSSLGPSDRPRSTVPRSAYNATEPAPAHLAL